MAAWVVDHAADVIGTYVEHRIKEYEHLIREKVQDDTPKPAKGKKTSEGESKRRAKANDEKIRKLVEAFSTAIRTGEPMTEVVATQAAKPQRRRLSDLGGTAR